MKILVAGAGYVGGRLARVLAKQGHEVTGWMRSEKNQQQLIQEKLKVICADITQGSSWEKNAQRWDAIVYCVSSSRGGEEAYRKIHQQGLALALEAKPLVFIYTSSTSVYGQKDGSVVDENSETQPESITSKILIQAEQEVLKHGGIVARLAGIYGSERQFWIQKILRGETMKNRRLNQIHRDDAVGALEFLLAHPEKGIFNVCDNDPVLWNDFCQWVCERIPCPMPTKFSSSINHRKRGDTHKCVSNAKLCALGWHPIFPTFREGYAEFFK
ncbi:MAG: NAD-dependent epimerase/dehydratase family protein [Verrucomicrobiota bacterium]